MKESEQLRQKLDTKPMFDDWIKRVQNKVKSPNERLYVIEKLQKEGKVVHHFKVNYAPETIVISKDVRSLKNMGFRLPFKIMSLAHSASNTYPYAISLLESVKNYDATNQKVSGRKGVDQLVVNYRRAVHELLIEGFTLTWDNHKIETYVAKMADATNLYKEKVYDLIEALDSIDVDMKALDTCQYSESVIGPLLASIQKRVDQLVVGKYSNLQRWVGDIDRTVEFKLARRVEEAVRNKPAGAKAFYFLLLAVMMLVFMASSASATSTDEQSTSTTTFDYEYWADVSVVVCYSMLSVFLYLGQLAIYLPQPEKYPSWPSLCVILGVCHIVLLVLKLATFYKGGAFAVSSVVLQIAEIGSAGLFGTHLFNRFYTDREREAGQREEAAPGDTQGDDNRD